MDTHSDSSAVPRITLAALDASSPGAIADLLQLTTPLRLAAGQILFQAGEVFQQRIYLCRGGRLEVRHGAGSFLAGDGELLGIDSYFDGSAYTATAVALDACQLEVIDSRRLDQLERHHPILFTTLNRLLIEPLRQQLSCRHQPDSGVWSLTARTVMQSPLATCEATLPVREAFRLMRSRRIGSLGVTDVTGELQGIVTYASLADGLIRQQARADDPVGDIVETPRTVDDNTPLWKVQGEQQRHRAKYLVVVERGRPVGVISQTDILETLASHQRTTVARIGEADGFEQLREFQARMGSIAQDLSDSNRSAAHAVRALSEVHLAIQRRCVELVLTELQAEGRGPAPMGYALIIMGSGGRKEMLVQTDQDNGLILAGESADEASRGWFVAFCERVNRRLDEVGYEWCRGDIMARNPDYHKSLARWIDHLDRITEIPTEKAARWATIFFDFETLYGDDSLCVALRTHLLQRLRTRPRLLRLMVEDDATGGPALGLFNRLVTASDRERRGKIDLKRNGTRILADAARIYALSEGIEATNSGDRLRALGRQGRLESAFVESLLAAQDELLDLALNHQIRQHRDGKALDKLLRPEELTPLEEESLRVAMRILKRLQGRMQGEFGTVML